MIVLKSGNTSAKISAVGAELKSFQVGEKEYMWNSDPAFWGKSFPILFPNIGFLKNNKTVINGAEYSLGKHGFARDSQFELACCGDSRAVFVLKSSETTLKQYPFKFLLEITYTLSRGRLAVKYKITNQSDAPMPYCFGLHPAFACPAAYEKGAKYDDCKLIFQKPETLDSPLIASDGTMDVFNRVKIMSGENELVLNHKLFSKDALTFEKINSEYVILSSPHNSIKISFFGFESFGLWAPVGAPFICVEPWCGMNDRSDELGIFEQKFGVQTLLPKNSKTYTLELQPMEV